MCKFVFERMCTIFLVFCLKCAFATNFEMLTVPRELRKHFERTARQIPSPKVYRCGEVGQDMVVNFVNANYPTDDAVAGDCRFRMVITSQHVCQIRVDFVDTELVDPVRGECLSQFFIVQGDMWPTGLPPLCGINNDQHFYLHLEPWYTNVTVVDFNLVTVIRGRPYRFGVWLTQIDCSSFNVLKAPEGCTQYFLTENGTIKSFNYEGYRYLNGQNYQICIKPTKGTCGIQYEAADGEFAMKKSIPTTREIMQRSGVGPAICGTDYLLVPEGREGIEFIRKPRLLFNRRRRPVASPVTQAPRKRPEVLSSADRFCGAHLSPQGGERQNRPIFVRVRSNLAFLRVKSSPLQEERGAIEALNLTAGFRLSYSQMKSCSHKEADLAIPQSIKAVLETLQWKGNGEVSEKREPSAESDEGNLSGMSTSENSTQIKDIADDDPLWDYLDMHSEDQETEEKDLYDF